MKGIRDWFAFRCEYEDDRKIFYLGWGWVILTLAIFLWAGFSS